MVHWLCDRFPPMLRAKQGVELCKDRCLALFHSWTARPVLPGGSTAYAIMPCYMLCAHPVFIIYICFSCAPFDRLQACDLVWLTIPICNAKLYTRTHTRTHTHNQDTIWETTGCSCFIHNYNNASALLLADFTGTTGHVFYCADCLTPPHQPCCPFPLRCIMYTKTSPCPYDLIQDSRQPNI